MTVLSYFAKLWAFWSRGVAGLTRHPVTVEIEGSNPFATASVESAQKGGEMAKRKKNKLLGGNNISWNQSYPGIILGLIVVVVIGLLVYNYFTATKTSGPDTNQVADQNESDQEVTKLPTTYKIERGDSLSKIAQKFYNSTDYWTLIAKENNIINPNIIHSGNVLRIPKPSGDIVEQLTTEQKPTLSQVSPTETIEKPKTERVDRYVIKRGDTLWKISTEVYGNPYLWPKIEKANALGKLPNGTSLIHADNVLIIPD